MQSRKVWGLPIVLLMLAAGLMLAGCGSSDDGGSARVETTTVEGALVDAPIVNGKVFVYGQDGELLDTTTTGLGGAYSTEFKKGSAPFRVVFTNNDGAAFLDEDGNGSQDPGEPNWNVPMFSSYVLDGGGTMVSSGSIASTLTTDVVTALHGGLVGQRKATVELGRNMVQGLFAVIVSNIGAEIEDSFNVLTTRAGVKKGANAEQMMNNFVMRSIQRSLVKMAQGATNNAILPADVDDAANSGQALLNALALLGADLADGKLDGVMLPGAAADLNIPDNFIAAFEAAAPTAADYAAWGQLDVDDVAIVFLQMTFETPQSFKNNDFDANLFAAADNMEFGVELPIAPTPPVAMVLNVFPNRLPQNTTQEFVDLETLFLDSNSAPIPVLDGTVIADFASNGTGDFVVLDPFFTVYELSDEDVAEAGKTLNMDANLVVNPRYVADSGCVKVLSDTAANRAKGASMFFETLPCALETDTFDNCTLLSVLFDIEDMDGNLLDNQSVRLVLDENAAFSDGSTSKTVTVNSGMLNDFEICVPDNLQAKSGVIIDSFLTSESCVAYAGPVLVVNSADQPWYVVVELSSPEALNPTGDTTVDVAIAVLDACGDLYAPAVDVDLSVVYGSIAPGTLSGAMADGSLVISVEGGEASGSVVYTAPDSLETGFEAFGADVDADTNASDAAVLPFL